MVFPFVFLSIGLLLGNIKLLKPFITTVDLLINISLIMLMLVIGFNIGVNDELMRSVGTIGMNCFVIAFLAIIFSVFFVFLVEKYFISLDNFKQVIDAKQLEKNKIDTSDKRKFSPLLIIMPLCIILGIVIGYTVLPASIVDTLDVLLLVALGLLYTGVGISLSQNKDILTYIKMLGPKILLISLAIFIGSLCGGIVATIFLKLPLYETIIPASGMSYYSVTGAYLSQTFGIEAGTYGFLVNVTREFLTILLLPILVRISSGSPIASGAAGNMDTMLVPITKVLGQELGLVALITGTVLTLFVPFVLPIIGMIIK